MAIDSMGSLSEERRELWPDRNGVAAAAGSNCDVSGGSISSRLRAAVADDTLIFVHAPRTGGSTLSRIMDWEYSPFQICDIDSRFYWWSFQRFANWSPERLAGVRLFKGHMPFGLHKYVPRSASYITLLRDPVDRTASEYYGKRYRRTHPIADRDAKIQGFEDYVKTVPYDNPQTKAIAGITCTYNYHWYTSMPSYRVYCGPCDADILETAKKNLRDYFCLVGITERFEETVALAKIMFGWKVPCFTICRQGAKRPGKSEITARQRDLVAKHNQFDMQLYSYGKLLFEQTVNEFSDRLPGTLETIERAAKPSSVQAMGYRARSFLRRHLIRTHCAMRRGRSEKCFA
jgi:hypothetical protein